MISPNQSLMEQARKAYGGRQCGQVLEILTAYRTPDPVFDPEVGLLKTLALLELAETALADRRIPYARELLAQAEASAGTTPYLIGELERRRLLLLAEAQPERREELLRQLPADDRELLLRAEGALDNGEYALCRSLLDGAADKTSGRWCFLRGEACFGLADYREAVRFYQQAEAAYPAKVIPRLEQCYLRQENYKMAYLYACKQREME